LVENAANGNTQTYFGGVPSHLCPKPTVMRSLNIVSRRPTTAKPHSQKPISGAIGEVIDGLSGSLNLKRLYIHRFGTFCSYLEIDNLRVDKAAKWFEEAYGDCILERYYRKSWGWNLKHSYAVGAVYILKDKLIVHLDYPNDVTFYYRFEDEARVLEIAHGFRAFHEKPCAEAAIRLVVASENGVKLKKVPFQAPRVVLQEQYNDDLVALHPQWLRHLRNPDSAGLYLFHGPPGTGKSSYIQHLIAKQKKRVLFLTPQLASQLAAPQLTDLLLENQNSIVVIEDAEEPLVARDHTRNAAISMLLNLTDGILGNSLRITFICTFNTEISRLDKALLRKGRLKGSYAFQPLETSKAQALLQRLHGPQATTETPMTLADIYNWQTPFYSPEQSRAAIGFSAAR